jgi:hypothetical protein
MFTYLIFGALRGSREGLMFHSCVPDLERHPELWADECPFPISSLAHAHIELVNGPQPTEDARAPEVPHAA